MTTIELCKAAKETTRLIASLSNDEKNSALKKMAEKLIENTSEILKANEKDVAEQTGKLSDAMIDRLKLTKDRIKGMADGLLELTKLPDPVGKVITEFERPNGMRISKRLYPLGVVAIIYESRPNVTSDAAGLCFKSGNACVLRGGKESYRSSKAIVTALKQALKEEGLPENAINLVDDITRRSANELMTAEGLVDLLIPRGGAGLIKACTENAKVPCIQTGTGICHIYVDDTANLNDALNIVDNAKTSRPSVCNAVEVLLVHESIAKEFLPALKARIPQVEIRLCDKAQKIIDGIPAGENDFDTEFLDYILAIKIVRDVDAAIEHILKHSTGHSEAIITETESAKKKFIAQIDSAAVYVNVSTRFTDGGEFGLGCEMGISTQKLHARGPMGLDELCTYKYVILGNGQVR
ncbi:MAG: glutamate-5-semialdehyde dehydrogenase [Ruminococcaceae bacterium]|nr:glutamate-5-semialdehyde dehydrogenase [Oscillospiraceae bacterium]